MRTIEEVIAERHQGDLISRSALRKDIEHLYSVYSENKDWFYTEVLDHIDNAQPVVNEYTKGFADGERSGRNFPLTDEEKAIIVSQWRPKGEWIDEGQYAEGHSEHYYRCSECGGHIIELRVDDFCKHCGADMRVKDELKTS